MNLRDWLIVIGAIIIVGILIDGYRRMRLARKDSLKISLEMTGDLDESPLDELPNPELPSGKARVLVRGIDSKDDELNENYLSNAMGEPQLSTELVADTTSDFIEPLGSTTTERLVADANSRVESDSVVPIANAKKSAAHVAKKELKRDTNKPSEAGRERSSKAPVQEVIVINVHAKSAAGFSGAAIKRLLEACGLNYGEMSIFHRHEEDDLISPIQFSVANSIEPGYFDPATLEQTVTPGVSFFMSLPGPKESMKAFDYMLETAQCFARNLNGELKDEQRSVMTLQTIEHCRQRVKEFERKQLMRSKV